MVECQVDLLSILSQVHILKICLQFQVIQVLKPFSNPFNNDSSHSTSILSGYPASSFFLGKLVYIEKLLPYHKDCHHSLYKLVIVYPIKGDPLFCFVFLYCKWTESGCLTYIPNKINMKGIAKKFRGINLFH